MKLLVPILAACALLLPHTVIAQPPGKSAGSVTSLTPRDARKLIKSAHNAVAYGQLADYFHRSEALMRAKAADEKVEWDRRARVNAPSYQKFPRPVDSAKSLYEYYASNADAAAAQASHYDQLAAGSGNQR